MAERLQVIRLDSQIGSQTSDETSYSYFFPPPPAALYAKTISAHHSAHGTREEHDVMFLAQSSCNLHGIRQFVLQMHSSVRSQLYLQQIFASAEN
jgi:hypothetical protein